MPGLPGKWGTHTVCDLTSENRCVAFFVDAENPIFAGIVDTRRPVTVGDALVVRDELLAEGFVFGRDFVIRKLAKQERG